MSGYLTDHIGELAGLTTAVCWTATALLFAAASRRLGVTLVNTARIVFAILLLALTHRAISGVWIPEAAWRQVFYLALSGVVGLSIGDQALFVAFVDIGPRVSTLIMTTSPLFAALCGGIVLGERLGTLGWMGMTMTIAGVAWVVLERSPSVTPVRARHYGRGVVLALVGAACQAGGLLLSKQGIGHGWLPPDRYIAPQTATLIRMVFAGVGMIPIILVHRSRQRRRRAAGLARERDGSVRAGYALALAGAVMGPYLGVWMSLVAADRAPLGVAQTLCSTVPIFMIPAVMIVHKERVSGRAALGALVAVAGSALLFARTN